MTSSHFAIGSSGDLITDTTTVTTDLATELMNLGSWAPKSPDHPIAKSPDLL